MCGIVGVCNVRKAIELAVVGAHQLQNRARTYAGGLSSDGFYIYRHVGEGLARQVFTDKALARLHGKSAIVHLRYPTGEDEADRENIQPVTGTYGGREFGGGHNGNLTNKNELLALLPPGTVMKTNLDSEYIIRLLEHFETGNIEEDLARVFSHLKGSFSLVMLFPDRLIAARDKSGNRPLSVGKVGQGLCVASENCAFPAMGAVHLFDIEPGTMVSIKEAGELRKISFAKPEPHQCVFELLYNSSPVSTIFGLSVSRFREEVGAKIEELFPLIEGIGTIVTPVPDSGNAYAYGYSRSGHSGQWRQVIIRNHYVGRTFNAATQSLRDEEVARKFIFDADAIRGRSVVVLDDSIVRSTTMSKIVAMLWQEGAREVHVRIGTPPIMHLCSYGIYMNEGKTDLIAASQSAAEICKKIGATSLEFLPLQALKQLLPDPENYCFACMDGNYW